MTNLRWFLLLLLAVGLVLFAVANWRFSVMSEAGFLSPMTKVLPDAEKIGVTVWPNTTVYLRLPVLILLMLGVVYIPMSLWTRTQKLLLRRQIGRLEKEVGSLRSELERARVELLRPPAMPETPAPETPAPETLAPETLAPKAPAPAAPSVPPQAIPQAPPPPGT
ncbi:hypothetical protein [Thermaurantiacus sp.]